MSLILAPLLSCFVSVQTRGVSSKVAGSKKSALPYLLGLVAGTEGNSVSYSCSIVILFCFSTD